MTPERSDTSTLSPKRILILLLISLVVAIVLLFTVVLPAEYGIDPLRTGNLLGITGMSKDQQVFEPLPQTNAPKSQEMEIVLQPYESLEIKFEMEQGGSLIYQWESDQELLYELHAEPEGAVLGYADTFDRDKSLQSMGTYIAPYDGIHGWFWENRTFSVATLKINVTGFFSCIYEFRDGFKTPLGDC